MLTLNTVVRATLLSVLTVTLMACSSTDTEDQEPAPLIDFDQERSFDKVWSRSIGNGQGKNFNRLNPVVSGDMIYVAAANGEVEAVTLAKGKRTWKADVDKLLVGGVGVGDKVVLLGSADGEVIALNKADGEELWRVYVGGEVLAAPQTNDSLVFVQTFDGQMLALNINDGTRVWSYRNTLPVLTLRGTSTPIIYRDAVITGFANGRVIAFDMETGAVRWNTRVAVAKGDSEIQRIIDIDGKLLENSGLIYGVSYQGKITAIDPSSGRAVWSNDASSYTGMAQGFGNVYVAGEDGSVTAFEKNGQGVRWAQTVLARRKLAGLTTLSSYVITADVEGYMHALSQVDGQIAARTRVDSSGVQVDLQTVGDRVMVYTNDGKLALYELEESPRGFFSF
ncbi:MAG: outer membrane protein assembly factor BamB [Spongiibacteraceae bacterium]